MMMLMKANLMLIGFTSSTLERLRADMGWAWPLVVKRVLLMLLNGFLPLPQ